MCCMGRESRRLEQCHNLMVGGGERVQRRSGHYSRIQEKTKFKKEGISARIISGAFPLKIRKMPIVSFFFLNRLRIGYIQKATHSTESGVISEGERGSIISINILGILAKIIQEKNGILAKIREKKETGFHFEERKRLLLFINTNHETIYLENPKQSMKQ